MQALLSPSNCSRGEQTLREAKVSKVDSSRPPLPDKGVAARLACCAEPLLATGHGLGAPYAALLEGHGKLCYRHKSVWLCVICPVLLQGAGIESDLQIFCLHSNATVLS